MRMQRVEFSIRQFPPSSFLSCSLFLLQMGRYICKHFITFALSSALNQLIAWTAALVRTILPLSAVQQGPSSDASVLTLPTIGGEGRRSWMRAGTGVCSHGTSWEGRTCKRWWGVGVAGRRVCGGRGLKRLRLGEEWLCRLLEHRSCCCSIGCVSFRHSPAPPRHEPRRKGVLLHAQLLCKSTGFYLGVPFCWWVWFAMGLLRWCIKALPNCLCVPVVQSVGDGVVGVLVDTREGCGY